VKTLVIDKPVVIKEGRILKIGKDGEVFYIIGEPDININEALKVALKIPVNVKVVEPDIDISQVVEDAVKDVPVTVTAGEIAKPHVTWVDDHLENELREKLRDIREKLKEVEEKKLELREVDEALADLEKELEKMNEEMPAVAHKHGEKLDVFTIVTNKGDQEAAAEVKPDIGMDIAEHTHMDKIKVIADKKGSFSIYCEAAAGEKGRGAYDRIVAKVKKDLPEGFTLEPSFEEDSGLMTLKVKGPSDKGVPSDLIHKLADIIREETKEQKE
jgi:hypothetical protein